MIPPLLINRRSVKWRDQEKSLLRYQVARLKFTLLRYMSKPPHQIRVVDILTAVEENVDAMSQGAGASGGLSGSKAQSMTNRLWEGLSANVFVYLHQTRLSDVVENDLAPCPAVPTIFSIVSDT